MHEVLEYGSACPTGCGGTLDLPRPDNCSCHVNPPCGACTGATLVCKLCGWTQEPEDEPALPEKTTPDTNPWWDQESKRSHEFGPGRRIFDWNYNSMSGSTMVFRGKYEGHVTDEEIIRFFGDGTFGHRGPEFYKSGYLQGTFAYVKVTD